MTIDFNLVALLDLLAFVQGTLLGILLMTKKKEHLSYFLLGLFLFMYSSELLISVLFDLSIFPQQPNLLYLPITFYFGFMPALYLYVKSLSETIDWKKYSWLFLPVVIEFIVFVGLFFQPVANKLAQYENSWTHAFYYIYVSFAMIYTIIYAILTLRLITKHGIKVKEYYSDARGKLLNWVWWICVLIIGINLLLLSGNIMTPSIFLEYTYPITSALNVIFIFWVALSGFRQKILDLPTLEERPTTKINTITPPQATTNEDANTYQKVLTFLEKEKSFTNPDLHLADLASQLHLSHRYLSELINQQSGTNFNQFINQLRVAEAKKLLVDDKYAHINILGIGYECGFNSKSAFYTAFKKEVNLTPAKYQKQARLTPTK